MRNLVLTATRLAPLPPSCGTLTATCADPERACTWLTAERLLDPPDDVEITILRLNDGSRTPEHVALHSSPRAVLDDDNDNRPARQIVALGVLPDEGVLALLTRAGEIATLALDAPDEPIRTIGDIDDGIDGAAWSPDAATLAIVTRAGALVLMSATFEVIAEGPLDREDFGADAPTALGWGSTQTQFHGSLGKSAASSSTLPALAAAPPSDDTLPRLTWRSDGAFLGISSLSPPSTNNLRRRVIRIFARDGSLQATSEPVPGLEHALAWRPAGPGLLAATQRFGGFVGAGQGRRGRHDVVFFERNGLRHGEFEMREGEGRVRKEGREQEGEGYRVRELGWSAGGGVFSVWISRKDADAVQLWTTGNYHWYLKQELTPPPGRTRFSSVAWHPEDAMRMLLTTDDTFVEQHLALETCSTPFDTGTVAVVDGANILLTPFRTSNVPPPMYAHTLPLPPTHFPPSAAPRHIALAQSTDTLCALSPSGHVTAYDLRTHGRTLDPRHLFSADLSGALDAVWRETALWDGAVAVLGATPAGHDILRLAPDRDDPGAAHTCVGAVCVGVMRGGRLIAAVASAPGHPDSTNVLADVDAPSVIDVPSDIEAPPSVDSANASTDAPASAQSATHAPLTLATSATSFACTAEFVIYTTAVHEAHFVRTEELCAAGQDGPDAGLPTVRSEKRRVERGARIVVAVPAATALVLQMPRGNLETIYPRPMVMAVVRTDVARGEYRKAFVACRKHRIDLASLVEQDFDRFVTDVPVFVRQVNEVEYLNLFLTSIGQSALSVERIGVLCDAVRTELERVDLKKYANCVLTAHVAKKPPELESALGVLLKLKESDAALVEDAVKYVIFLVDANTLFDVALGMYDFELVLMIAQYAQKDPREYLPFLRTLRALQPDYQRFKIDDHLRRHASALRQIARAGSEHFNEALAYAERHRLLEDAIQIWKSTEQYPAVLTAYGEHLFERREFRQAAIAFVEAAQHRKALVAYEKALLWRELFDLALRNGLEEEELLDTAYRVADDLIGKKRFGEAGRVLLDFAKDVRGAVNALVLGSDFSEARRILALHRETELLEELVHPATLDARQQTAEDLAEMREQLRKQVARVVELRVKKTEEPDAFYGIDDAPELHNVDVMTDASAFTAFTRYTAAPSAATGTTSKRSSRSKRKMERKVGSGRKGTVDEEEYLLKSITKLVERFRSLQEEAGALIPHLLQFTPTHRAEACTLQADVAAFETELSEALAVVWPATSEEQADDEVGWAKRMDEYARERERAVKAVKRPDIGTGKDEWRARVVEVGGV
ncbi:IKI3 family-domain-containing protein [Vararia minispora EC-137]|uniref:IKI3 family-domain-containing protein n=1 Tax=Vararia minispora EC-137 TaxID=1314806 RepID=A0ACB8QGR7_9AGAM|nr:IKI3 family-domain-containing protein [Vararia minispora EC-137]